MTTATGKTFVSGNSEAVRLPRGIAYGAGTELVMIRRGQVTTLYPKPKQTVADMISALRALGVAGSQSDLPEGIEFPDRPGL